MTVVSVLLAFSCIAGTAALSATRLVANQGVTSTLSREWRSCLEVESEDVHFWSSAWSAMESELLQLQAAAVGQPATTAEQPTAKAAKHPKESKHFNPLAGLKLNLNPKSPADLVPALAMLKGLYEDGKERIGKLNAREKDSKQKFEAKQKQHEERVATIAARLKNGSLSKEFAVNETRDETRFWTYWTHVRERQHRQYHTSLKIQHGTLSKEKQMIDMYEKTIAGKESKQQLAKEFAKKVGGGAMPEVVLFQETREAVAEFCQDELAEVRSSQVELLQVETKP